ncbi:MULTISPECIES: ABC transporter ATP-binding protein [unclassified Shinella]|uniref:ABC transporter ATP-binding protein n=1 Tax=unclassified Shinella TaxID=2643062 RepID=UPI00225CF491|nr:MULTISPECIES: ABC transporter ATP-binding protein [unclassified Shinella]MCO5139199.1 ABC transporter ATP-binding protein [Shinella sp.]MDC7256071.1 ABC transporter ATP-binding protein [Shinella sp. YE25]CAI0338910.1 Glutathione import ATP-binding protein GsiA [Rhizobiaceae bacterium]CAK7257336.1 glutathione ABC transporter ATP binding subunit GsiA [Shinella sp. WSC3-e]
MTDLHRNPAGTILAVRSLDVSLPRNMERSHAVEGVSLDLRQGEILCVVGESGSGKSVTASTVMGLLPPAMRVTGGEILYKGRDLIAMPEAERRQLRGKAISMIFQDPLSALNPLMTIEEQIDEVFVAHGVTNRAERERRVLELVTEVGLPDPPLIRKQYPFRLSGGQRQRVMIAIALALDPDILIADEPTTALDVTIQAQILDLIRRLQAKKNTSVMFITHDFGVVADIADRVVVMEKGHVVEEGTADAVLRDPQHPYTRRLIAAVPRLREAENEVKAGETVLEVRGLSKTYRSHAGLFGKVRVVPAVEDVSFTLHRGETLGVVGESGSGKSSMGKVLMKLVEADAGEILLGGRDIRPMGEAAFRQLRPRIQMIFQDPFASLNPRLTIGTSLTVGPVAHGLDRKEAHRRALGLLERVGLGAAAFERYPHEFSGGQRQRVGIARALMFDPQIIVADEAVSALDVSIQAQILQLLAEVQAEKHLAMIFITHDLRVASQICDQVIVMNRGRVVEAGTPMQIFHNPQEAYSRQLMQAIPGADL